MDLVRLIQHPELMNKETLYELRSLVALYPYYQTARLLMLQNMYLMHDSAFDDELHRAALYVSDRSLLFELVEGAHYKIKTAQELADEKSAISAAQRDNATAGNRTISLIDSYLETAQPDNDNQAQQSKSKPTPADAAIDYVAYLLKQENDEEEKTDNDSPQLKGQELIDDFIIQPSLYSKRVNAHPLEVFIVILISGHIGGVVGMLLAIPSYTVIRVIAREFFSEYGVVRRLTGKINE